MLINKRNVFVSDHLNNDESGKYTKDEESDVNQL